MSNHDRQLSFMFTLGRKCENHHLCAMLTHVLFIKWILILKVCVLNYKDSRKCQSTINLFLKLHAWMGTQSFHCNLLGKRYKLSLIRHVDCPARTAIKWMLRFSVIIAWVYFIYISIYICVILLAWQTRDKPVTRIATDLTNHERHQKADFLTHFQRVQREKTYAWI